MSMTYTASQLGTFLTLVSRNRAADGSALLDGAITTMIQMVRLDADRNLAVVLASEVSGASEDLLSGILSEVTI